MPTIQFKISNLKFKIRRGYTLIEFLIVIGILSVSIGSVFMILTSVIKGSNQANIGAEVKQNGQAVLEGLERQIRIATNVRVMGGSEFIPSGASTGNSGMVLTKPTGGYIYLICVNKDSTVPPTYNGWIGIASGTSDLPPPLASSYQSLTANTDLISGVDIDCTAGTAGSTAFRVDTATSSVKVVTISFTANQGVSAPSRVDFKANAKFQTVISLRQF